MEGSLRSKNPQMVQTSTADSGASKATSSFQSATRHKDSEHTVRVPSVGATVFLIANTDFKICPAKII